MGIYQPAEDSFLLLGQVKKYLKTIPKEKRKNLKALDLGTGSGIQTINLVEFLEKENITSSDINPEALKNKKIKTIKSDLFENIKEKFDIIVFNPPYLPEDKYDKEKDTTGGKKGDETVLEFLKQVKNHLNENAKIFLLLSSLTPRKKIDQEIKKNFSIKKLAEKKMFCETLEVYLLLFT